jgi:Sporulation and spore germination
MRRSNRRPRTRSSVGAALVLVALTLGLAACGGDAPQSALTSTTTTVPPTTVPKVTTTLAASAARQVFTLFFVRGTTLGVAQRTVATTTDPHFSSMTNLLAGPDPSEASAGLTTDIPAGTALRGLEIRGGTATVNLSPQFAATAPTAALSARLAQIVYTITSFPNVTSVVIEIAKTRVVNFAGVNLTNPVGRSQVTAAVPGVLLESPGVGSTLSGQLAVSGVASINGTYDIQLLEAGGKLLANVTDTAAVDEKFTQTLPFTIATPQVGEIKVFARPAATSQPVQEYQFSLQLNP